ncbi:MAG: acetate/propionate family kinase [Erysipelotrichaceae bacterium]|nr:acetate/propionate family kinase [Erysipelotrichaceae bacterium]
MFLPKHKVRKYGFHGTSHRFVSAQALEALHNPNAKIIVCHLGNGASLAAIDAGKCVNTSMGFTPLAGIMMGTRSGDIDPSIIPFVQKALHLNSDDALEVFNKESGLLGVSGISSDMRDIQKAMDQGHPDAILAIEMYVERIGMLIASYIAQLKGCDAIIFTAGVGENATFIRERVIDYLTPVFKVTIDSEVNKKRGEFLDITGTDSSMKVYVIPTNEELMIALDTYQLIA